MTKIWTQSFELSEYTKARILNDMRTHLDLYMLVMSCQSFAGHFPQTCLEILSDHQPADYFDVGGMFIVSAHLREVLESFKIHAEFFPVRLVHKKLDLTSIEMYYCNILDCVEAFNLSLGKYTFWKKAGFTDHIQKIRKLVINETIAEQYHLFRMAKCSANILCVSEQLADRISQLRLTGMRFIQPQFWRFGM